MELLVEIFWDDEAKIWWAKNDKIKLCLENESYDSLIEAYCLAAPEMAELNNVKYSGIRFKSEKVLEAIA